MDLGSQRRIPSLVQYCQRVASNHVDSISSLGSDLSYELLKSVLESCSADQLRRLEETSPHLVNETEDIWKRLCFRKYPAIVDKHTTGLLANPDSWREHYFVLLVAEAKRLEEIGTRLRSQRMEADERKKEREVKLTDRLPPPKRSRGGWSSMPAQPKTLYQKTRIEASKIQKNVLNARKVIPSTVVKDYRSMIIKPPMTPLLEQPPSRVPGRVTVRSVQRRIHPLPAKNLLQPSPPSSFTSESPSPPATTSDSFNSIAPPQHPPPRVPAKPPQVPPLSLSEDPRLRKSPKKKDPIASMFMPKQHAYSQRVSA